MSRRYKVSGQGQRDTQAEAQAAAQFFSRSQIATHTRHSLNPSLRVEEQQARRALELLEDLSDNWDGYGAVEISKPVRINAWQALRDFVAVGAIPEVSPTTNGTVAFDWQANGVRGHCEIGTNTFSMFVTSSNGLTQFFNGTDSTVSDDACTSIASALSRSTISELPSMTPIRIAGESGR